MNLVINTTCEMVRSGYIKLKNGFVLYWVQIRRDLLQMFVHQIRMAFLANFRAVDVENAIKLASADDGFVTYDELRENLRKWANNRATQLYHT